MSDKSEPGDAPQKKGAQPIQASTGSPLVARAFVVMVVVMASTLAIMVWACFVQVGAFQKGIDSALTDKDFAAVAAFSTGVVASFVKTLSILMSFLLIFAGAAYVLLPIEVKLRASGEGAGAKGSLETNSPGLVLVVVGAILAGVCVMHDVEIHYNQKVTAKAPANVSTGDLARTGCNPVTNPNCAKDADDKKKN